MLSTKFDSKNKLWKGNEITPIYNAKVSLGQVILKVLEVNGPKFSQISDDNGLQISCYKMWLRTVRAAQNIQKYGYQPKDVFTFVAKNSDFLAPVIFASFCLGCPINTLDPSFAKSDIIHMLKITKPRLMFCDVDVYPLVSECLTELNNEVKIFTFGGQCGSSEAVENLFVETGTEKAFIPVQIDGEDTIAAILCSSGTTGAPKGVSLSHAVLLDNMMNFHMLKTDDRLLCFSTLYWISGVCILLIGTLNGATRVITKQKFSPELQLKLIEKYNITFTFNATHQMVLISKSEAIKSAKLSSIQYSLIGGSKITFDTLTTMRKYITNGEVVACYGLTEVGMLSNFTYLANANKDSVGNLFNGFSAKVINEEGQKCGVGIDGEICLKSNYKFIGYYGNEKATSDVFDEDGFFMTGDIGHFDENGHMYIVDRKKEMFKYCGFQITPSEIESHLLTSSKIKAVCVVGIPDANGDLPAAVVVRNDINVTEEELYNMVSNHFTDQHKLRGGIYFIDTLPVTPSGKVMRRKAKEIALEMLKDKNQ